jgi:hypothetical protein
VAGVGAVHLALFYVVRFDLEWAVAVNALFGHQGGLLGLAATFDAATGFCFAVEAAAGDVVGEGELFAALGACE